MFDGEAYLKHFGFNRIKEAGENYMASCPDFKNKHPRGDIRQSWGIHKETGLSNCFMCDTRLNLEQLTAKLLSKQKERNVDEYEAWLWLEDKNWLPKKVDARDVKQKLRDIKDEKDVLKPYEESILEEYKNGVHPSIVKVRGIAPSVAKEFELRYDTDMKRTIIPVRTKDNKLIGLTSRAISNDAYIKHAIGVPQPQHVEENIKYQFKKKMVMFGENKFTSKNTLMVVESPLDVLYAYSNGLNKDMDIGALFGAKASPYHIDVMVGYKKVIVATDNDRPGKLCKKYIKSRVEGKTKLEEFNHFGYKDLGEVPPEMFVNIKDKFQNSLKESLSELTIKTD